MDADRVTDRFAERDSTCHRRSRRHCGADIQRRRCGDPINHPPTITTTPPFVASVGLAYRYDADASDPEGDALTFALLESPAGMSIDPTIGSDQLDAGCLSDRQPACDAGREGRDRQRRQPELHAGRPVSEPASRHQLLAGAIHHGRPGLSLRREGQRPRRQRPDLRAEHRPGRDDASTPWAESPGPRPSPTSARTRSPWWWPIPSAHRPARAST